MTMFKKRVNKSNPEFSHIEYEENGVYGFTILPTDIAKNVTVEGVLGDGRRGVRLVLPMGSIVAEAVVLNDTEVW